tara:strand:- start:219 stop:404 length:186 start_codon:yes stop_codon:yes gene_type:complete
VKVGDLIQYRHDKARSQIGLVVKIDNERETDGMADGGDRYLIQWSNGRRWFVAKDWVEVVQ